MEKIRKKMKDDLFNQLWFKVWGDVPHLGGDGWCTKCGEQFEGQRIRRIALYEFCYEVDPGCWYRTRTLYRQVSAQCHSCLKINTDELIPSYLVDDFVRRETSVNISRNYVYGKIYGNVRYNFCESGPMLWNFPSPEEARYEELTDRSITRPFRGGVQYLRLLCLTPNCRCWRLHYPTVVERRRRLLTSNGCPLFCTCHMTMRQCPIE